MLASYQDLESMPNGGVILITHRWGLVTDERIEFIPCRHSSFIKRTRPELWEKRIDVVKGDIRQRIF